MLILLAFSTAMFILAVILWISLVKKNIFDPRLYVLYGLFHWVIVAQLGTLLGYSFYGPKPYFEEIAHMKVAFLILFAVVFFLGGYHFLPVKAATSFKIMYNLSDQLNTWKLAKLSFVMGFIGISSSLFFQRNLTMITVLKFTPLLLTYMVTAAGVIAAYVLIMERRQLTGTMGFVFKFALGLILLYSIIMSNVVFIFPLFAIIYWSIYKVKMIGAHVKISQVIKWALIIAIIGVFSIVSKRGLQPYIATGKIHTGLLEETMHRVKTLDLFNVEGYGIILHAMEMYPDSGNLLLGKSFLVLLPFLRLVWDDIRGFGRIMVLDVYGLDYLEINVSWSIPPIGELLANFGYLSVIIFYLLLGWIARYLYECFKRSNSIVYVGIYSVVLPWLFFQQRGDFLNGNVPSAYIACLVGFTFWLCQRRVQREAGAL